MDFIRFRNAVSAQFAKMAKIGLYRTDVLGDELWNTYLSSFPAGTDPIYRERSEHDCTCCKQFIRTVGNVVTIVDSKLVSIWDIDIGDKDPEYQQVANALSAKARSAPIKNIFLHYENKVGTNKTFEKLTQGVHVWEHFAVAIPAQKGSKNYVVHKTLIDTQLGQTRADFDVFYRSLSEITIDAVDTVLELISQDSIYRGREHNSAVSGFKQAKVKFDKKTNPDAKAMLVWEYVTRTHSVTESVMRFRNTVIGTLAVDISNGVELDRAVAAFEAKVAPHNYKRPKALVTKNMIASAKKAINELGLDSALERRYAILTDITVNNILFADRSIKKVLAGDVFDTLMENANNTVKSLDKVQEVSIDKFVSDILPTATKVEVLFENRHTNNLVSLIAPADPGSLPLFKWDNKFSWSYTGDVADSIKEKVKHAGGNVSGEFCCRLAWYNYDDLDLYMTEPNGFEVYFGRRGVISSSGGVLDVDMNAGRGTTRTPVENIVYNSINKMKPGKYTLSVKNFCKRDEVESGFDIEIDIQGKVYTVSHGQTLFPGGKIVVAEFEYTKEGGLKLITKLDSVGTEHVKWGISTQKFHPVNVIMNSPNHWDDSGVGNRHIFFMINGCINEDTARGFYNEFLDSRLDKHRKVMEMVGSRVRTNQDNEQLSGLGFSSTQRNSVVCRVQGKFSRTIKVMF